MMRISPGVTTLSVGPVTMLSYPPAPETAMRSVGVGRKREGRDAGQGDVWGWGVSRYRGVKGE
jgi:hypothetical protein